MLKQSLSLGTVLATAALLSAQGQPYAVLPPAQATVEGNSATSYPWNRTSNGIRLQQIFDSSCFAGMSTPITMTALKWRINGSSSCSGGTYAGVTIDLSTAVVDYMTPNTTFASNHGLDQTTVYNGTVTVQPTSAASPNLGAWFVDVPLTTPFVYDPALGDLLVDVIIPNSSWSGASTTSTDYEYGAGTLGTRIYALDPTAATGSIITEATPVMGFDVPNMASAGSYGLGCYDSAASFYELFNSTNYDLPGGVGVTNSILLTPNTNGGYDVTAGSNTWYAPTSANLGLGDDALSAFTLPFTFTHIAGSTTDIQMCSNGFIWLDNTSTSTDYSPTAAEFLSQAPRIAAAWQDLNPSSSGTGTTHIDVDPSGNTVYVTWLGVQEYGYSTNLNDIQVALDVSGTIEIRWQQGAISSGDLMVGYSIGNGARDGGPTDISASLPFSTATDSYPLAMTANGRPVMGMPATLQVDNFPAGTILGCTVFSWTQYDPGLSLAPYGIPGCFQNVGLDWVQTYYVPTGTSETINLGTLPSGPPSWMGSHVYLQAVAFVPGINPVGVITSNGVDLMLDIN